MFFCYSVCRFWQAVKEMKNNIIVTPQSNIFSNVLLTDVICIVIGNDITPTSLPRNSSFWQALSTDGPSGHVNKLNTNNIIHIYGRELG